MRMVFSAPITRDTPKRRAVTVTSPISLLNDVSVLSLTVCPNSGQLDSTDNAMGINTMRDMLRCQLVAL